MFWSQTCCFLYNKPNQYIGYIFLTAGKRAKGQATCREESNEDNQLNKEDPLFIMDPRQNRAV